MSQSTSGTGGVNRRELIEHASVGVGIINNTITARYGSSDTEWEAREVCITIIINNIVIVLVVYAVPTSERAGRSPCQSGSNGKNHEMVVRLYG